MSAKFYMIRDINGYNGFGLSPVDVDFYNTTLAAGVAQTFNVPSMPFGNFNKWLVVFAFEPGTSVWVAYNATAAGPGSSFASATSELNPTARAVLPSTTISFITNNTNAEIGVSLYAVQQQ